MRLLLLSRLIPSDPSPSTSISSQAYPHLSPAYTEQCRIYRPSLFHTSPTDDLDSASDEEDYAELTRNSSSTPTRAGYASGLVPHLAALWHLDSSSVVAVLLHLSPPAAALKDGERVYVDGQEAWSAALVLLQAINADSQSSYRQAVVRLDVVVDQAASIPAAGSRQEETIALTDGASVQDPIVAAATSTATPTAPTTAATTATVETYDDPEEAEVPGVERTAPAASDSQSSHSSSSAAPPTAMPLLSTTATTAALLSMDLADNLLSSLGSFARSVSNEAEAVRSSHRAAGRGPCPAPFAASTDQTEADQVQLHDADLDAQTRDEPSPPGPLPPRAEDQHATDEPHGPDPNGTTLFSAFPSHTAARRRSSLLPRSTTLLSTLTTLFLLLTLALPALAASPRHHLCKCTCFSTNSTLVPLFAPLDPAKPCLTCTRQFCIDQGLEICKGARVADPDADTGTGYEGDVWAKCFERDEYKDQSIIVLYLLTVVGLLVVTALRGRVRGWYDEYRSAGPRGLYNAVASAPWRTR